MDSCTCRYNTSILQSFIDTIKIILLVNNLWQNFYWGIQTSKFTVLSEFKIWFWRQDSHIDYVKREGEISVGWIILLMSLNTPPHSRDANKMPDSSTSSCFYWCCTLSKLIPTLHNHLTVSLLHSRFNVSVSPSLCLFSTSTCLQVTDISSFAGLSSFLNETFWLGLVRRFIIEPGHGFSLLCRGGLLHGFARRW